MRTTLLLLAAITFLATGCGSPRRYGDAGGVPVDFDVSLHREYITGWQNRQGRVSAGVGMGFSSHGSHGVGMGIGLSFSATSVYLLGGSQPGSGDVFVKELKWGSNRFSVPLLPGRHLVLSIQASGGRSGWASVGNVIIGAAAQQTISVVCDTNGSALSATASGQPVPTPAAAPEPATPPAAAPQPPAPPPPQ